MKTNRWIWEKVKIELTNPQGETVILNSDSFDDYTFGIISEAVEKYVVDQGLHRTAVAGRIFECCEPSSACVLCMS